MSKEGLVLVGNIEPGKWFAYAYPYFWRRKKMVERTRPFSALTSSATFGLIYFLKYQLLVVDRYMPMEASPTNTSTGQDGSPAREVKNVYIVCTSP